MKIYMIIGLILSTVLMMGLLVFGGDAVELLKSIFDEAYEELDPFAVCLALIAAIIGIGAIWAPYLLWVILYVIKEKIESKKDDEVDSRELNDLADKINKEFE